MGNRFAQRFAALKAAGRHAFLPFTLLGWPNAAASFENIKTMIDAGVSALELGFAFGDPVADGPIIQQAAKTVLDSGFTMADGFALLEKVRAYDSTIPIGVLVYTNMVLSRGWEGFFAELARVGADAALIVDLPPESAAPAYQAAQAHGIDLIFIVSPITTPERLQHILRYAGAFIYVVSRLGITGTDETADTRLGQCLSMLHQQTVLPCCVGFGVSSPAHAQRMIALGADGVITGSALFQTSSDERRQTILTFLA